MKIGVSVAAVLVLPSASFQLSIVPVSSAA